VRRARLITCLVPLLLAGASAGATAAPRLGFDRHDDRCTTARGIFRLSWTETAFSRNRVQGADGRCASVPAHVERVARDLEAADAFARGAGFARPLLVAGQQRVDVLDVRGPTGAYGFTAGDARGSATIYLDTYLLRAESRPLAGRTLAYAIWNRLAPDVFHRFPAWVVQGTAGWFQAAVAPSSLAVLSRDLASLARASSSTPVTDPAIGRGAVGFWRVVAGPGDAAIVRATYTAARNARVTTALLVRTLDRATGGTLAERVGTYALDLARGTDVGGVPVPPGWRVRRRPRLVAVGPYAGPPRAEALDPLGVRLVPVTWTDAPVAHTITVQAPTATAAQLLARSCAVIVGDTTITGSAAGRSITWSVPGGTAAGSTTLVLASAAITRLTLRLGVAAS
jgi:hypothetical protein